MAKPYEKLLGNRIYVNVPKKEEKSKIIVDSACEFGKICRDMLSSI